MDTKIIEYVIAIAEEKSLSKAAERLYLTQPALSQRLKALEDELGTPLFIRDKGGMTITDAGRIYVNGGRSILQIKQEALGKLSGMDRNNKDRLRFGCATSQALECIPAFRQQYPDIELITQRCDTPTAKESLIMGRMDIAVLLTSSLQHSTLEYLPLSRAEVILAVPRQHRELTAQERSQRDYDSLKDDYFILSPPLSYSRDMEEQALRIMGIQPKVLCEIRDNVSRRYMLNRNLGNGFLPSYSIRDEDTFYQYPFDPPLDFHVVAAYPKTLTLSEPMKYMLWLLLALFEKRVSQKS